MKAVFQSIADPEIGDCQRACVASILELDLIQVPNFRMFPDKVWFHVYYYFMYANGWQYSGCTSSKHQGLLEEDSINGFFEAVVKSRTYEDRTHGVIIDKTGLVVHDPNPNQSWLGEDILESGEVDNWYIFEKVEKVIR